MLDIFGWSKASILLDSNAAVDLGCMMNLLQQARPEEYSPPKVNR
jgi:hypothetical protein